MTSFCSVGWCGWLPTRRHGPFWGGKAQNCQVVGQVSLNYQWGCWSGMFCSPDVFDTWINCFAPQVYFCPHPTWQTEPVPHRAGRSRGGEEKRLCCSGSQNGLLIKCHQSLYYKCMLTIYWSNYEKFFSAADEKRRPWLCRWRPLRWWG